MCAAKCIETNETISGIAPLDAAYVPGSWRDWVQGGKRLLVNDAKTLMSILRTWHARSVSRAHLAALDDRMLDDIGITRQEARRIARKPFWKA